MFYITDYMRNANQNHNEMSLQMAIIKKSTNNKCWRGCRESGTLPHCQWACKLVRPLWRTLWRFLKKLKTESYHMTLQFHSWAYIWRKMWSEDICIPMLIAALFATVKTQKQPKCIYVYRVYNDFQEVRFYDASFLDVT